MAAADLSQCVRFKFEVKFDHSRYSSSTHTVFDIRRQFTANDYTHEV